MTTSKCQGSGQKGRPSAASLIYPACQVCGREFSAQGRKANARIGNAWERIPAHMTRKGSYR